MKRLIILAAVAFLARAQVTAQDQSISSLDLLIGKKVIVQRMPLCQPGTFTVVMTYAGKQGVVDSMKPTRTPRISQQTLNRLPAETRAMLEDQYKGATILVKFDDGAVLDTCAPVTPRSLPNYFELIPGQILQQPTPDPARMVTGLSPQSPQECPVAVVKATSSDGGFRHALADGLTKSQFERAVEKANHAGHDAHYLDTRMKNNSRKSVKAIEAFVVYADKMGDPGARETILSQNDKDIPPGGEYKGYAVDTAERWANGRGEVTVFINRVRFEDDTMWQDNGSHSCALTSKIK